MQREIVLPFVFPVVWFSFLFLIYLSLHEMREMILFKCSPQGGHIKIHLHSDIPVQVDGEPWVQSPGDIVVLKSALKVISTQAVHNDPIILSEHRTGRT